MQKHLQKLLLIVAMMLVPWVANAQDAFSYSCNFDSDSDTAGWVFVNGSQTNQWFIGTAAHNSGTKGLYISNDNGTSNSYSGSTTFVYAYQEFTLDSGGYAVSYDWRCQGEGNYDYLRVFLAPSTVTLPAGASPNNTTTSAYTWGSETLPAGCISLTGSNMKLNLQSSWQNVLSEIYVPTSGTWRLVFAWANDASVYNSPAGGIDNIVFMQPTCPRPSNLSIFNIAQNSFDVSWTETGSATEWLVWIDSVGITVDSTIAYDTTASFIGRAANTLYTVRVAALCGGIDTSMMLVSNFRTPCTFLDSLPFSYGFEDASTGTSAAFPNCWVRLNNGSSYGYYPYVNSSSTYNHTPGGSKGLYWYNTTTTGTYGDYQCVVLPGVDTDTYPINSLRLSFWAKASSTSYNPSFQVGVMTNPSDISTFQTVTTVNVGNTTTWTKFVTELSDFEGQGNFIAIKALRASWTAYVDDIQLDQAPDCTEPTNIIAQNITTETATLTWTEGGDATSWTIVYGEHGFSIDTGISESVGSLPYTITGLSPNTEYDVYISPECMGVAGVSLFSFRTECVALDSLPYTMGFETSDGVASTGSSTSSTFVECWHRLNNGTDYFGYPYVGSSTYAHTGSRGLYWYNTTTTGTYGDYQVIVLPSIDTDNYPLRNLRVTFWSKTSSGLPTFLVGVMTNPNNVSTFHTVNTINVGNSGEWRKYVTTFADYSDTGTYVAIRANRASWTAYVDDITLEVAPDCPEVSDIVASNITTNTANISWTENGIAESWNLEYGLHGFTPDSGSTVTVTTLPVILTGLTSNTEYDVYITPDCSGTTGTESFTFRTECDAVSTIPLTMGFESSEGVSTGSSTVRSFIECWHRLNNGSQYYGYPYVGSSSTYAHTGSRGLYWYNTTTTGTYGDYEIVVLPAIDVTTHPINTLQLKFWARSSSSSYYPSFQVGVMTDPNNASTFQVVGNVSVSNSTQWEEFTTGLANYSGSGQYVAIRSLRSLWTAYVDDITLEQAPSCPNVVDITIEEVGTSGAYASWSYQSGFADSPASYDVSVYHMPADTLVVTYSATTNSQLIGGLTPNSQYKLRVRPVCSLETGLADSVIFSTISMPCLVADTTINDTVVFSTGTNGVNGVFVNSAWGNTFSQSIYTASELNALGIHSGRIKGVRLGYTAAGSYNKELTIFMGNTTLSTFTSTSNMINPSTMTQVYGPTLHTPTSANVGWVYYEFTTPFEWDGISNIVLSTFMNQQTGSSQSSSGFYGYSTPAPSGSCIYKYKDSNPFTLTDCMTSGTSGSSQAARPSITFITDGCSAVGTCAPPMVVVDSTGSDYIAVNWVAGNQETSWDVEYRESGGTWISEGMVTTPGYIFTGLNANQEYEIRITALCTDTNMAALVSVVTPCNNTPLPFFTSFENFPGSSESYPMPSCWKRVSNYYPYYPYSSTSYRVSGSYAVYMYSSNTTYSYFTLPPLAASVDSLVADFWLLKTNTSYSHSIKVGVMTDPTDISTFTEVATVSPSGLYEWEHFEVYFDQYMGNGRYITFMSPNNEYSYPYLDDLTIDYIPDCRRVQNVAVSNITTNSVHVSWTAGDVNDFDVVCVPSGTDPNLGTIYNVSGDDSINITGLMHSTAYVAYVRGYCYPDTSQWSLGTNFRTSCGLIDTLPFYEDFESLPTGSTSSYDFVPCWTLLTDGSSRYPYVSNSTSYSHSGGNKGLYWYRTNSYGDYDYVILPQIDTTVLPINTLQFSVWVKSSSTSYSPVFEVGVMNSPLDTAFTRLRTIRITNSSNWQQIVVPLSRYHGNGTYVAIRGIYENSYWYAYADEFMLDTLPSCPMPLDIVVDSVSTDYLAVTWLPSGTESQWQVTINGIDTIVNDTSLVLTGLTPNTPYHIGVRALCGPGSLSDEVSVTLRTECSLINIMPWHDDLETYTSTSSSSPDLMPCWNKITDATSYYYPYLSNSTTYSHNGGSMGLYWYLSTSTSSYGSYQTVALPLIDTNILPINTLQMAFWAKPSSTSYSPAFEMGVMVDNNPSTFVPLDTAYLTSSDWQLFEVSAAAFTGSANRFAIRASYSLTSNYWYAYVDDFFIEPMSPCPRPDSLLASNATSNSVVLSWHETGEATEWVIEYGPRGFQPGTGTQVYANTNPYTLYGIPSSYDGEFYVRSLCSASDTGYYNRYPGMFSTAQAPATIPYHYNFEDATEWDAWQTNSNTYINWARGTAVVDSGNYAMYISPNNGTTYGNEGFTSLVNASVFRDIDFGTVDTSFTITFRAKVGGSTDNSYDGLMVFLVDPAIPVVASTSAITAPWGNVNDLYRIAAVRLDTAWSTYSASFDTIHGVHRVAFFWFNQNTASSHPFIGGPAAVDNIHIDYSSCPRPVNLDTTALTSTTASLHWDGPTSGTYRVAYRVVGQPASTNVYVNTSTNSVVLTGLDPMTSYRAWVQKLCGTDSSLFSDGVEFQTEMCEDAVTALSYDPAWATTTSNYAPMGYSYYNYGYVQTLIDSAQLAGLDGPITAMAFNPVDGNMGEYYTNMDIYLANVPESDLSVNFIYPDTTTHRFVQVTNSADLTYSDGGWHVFALDTTFEWDGHSNLLVSVNRRHGSYSSGASFHAHSTTGIKTRYLYQDTGPYNPAAPSGGSTGTGSYVGDLKFISCGTTPTCHTPIITSVSHTYENATINWTGDGTDYEVNIKESAATDWPATDIAVTGNTYTFTGLQPATSYTYRVRQDCTADSLGYSEWVIDGFTTDSLPCLAPDSLHVTAVTNSTATLDWNPRGNETAWDVHVWTSGGRDTIWNVISHPATVGGFTANTSYNASVRPLCGLAQNIVGDWGDTITFTTAVCPDVTGLGTRGVTANSVEVYWDPDPMAQTWIIEYGFHGFDLGTGTQVTTSLTTYTINGLMDDMEYDFRVRAVCGDNWQSEGWATTSATTLVGGVPCDPPTAVSAVVAGNAATVSWTANTGNLNFVLEYGTRGFALGSGTTVNATASPVTISNLDYETAYDVYVKANCADNTSSAWSTVASFTTEAQGSEDCDPVTDLAATNVTESAALLTWTPGNSGDEWEVVLTTAAGATVSENSTTERQFQLNGLTPGTAYVAKVRTVCGDGQYSTFASVSFTTNSVGIADVTAPACTIYPNPTSGATTVSVSGISGKVRIAVVDMNGREVTSETLDCSGDCAKTMSVDNLAQGAYFVRITGENANMVRKLIVR